MRIDARRVIERRQAERRELIDRVAQWSRQLDPGLGVMAVVVFGSVARGDFNVWSDIDVLVVAEHLPERSLDRWDVLAPLPPLVQPVVWTPGEYAAEHRRANPIVAESVELGVWLLGDAAALDEGISGRR